MATEWKGRLEQVVDHKAGESWELELEGRRKSEDLYLIPWSAWASVFPRIDVIIIFIIEV